MRNTPREQGDDEIVLPRLSRSRQAPSLDPPIATYPITLPKPSHPIPTTRPDGTGYDPQSDQNAQARVKMRNICRGCQAW